MVPITERIIAFPPLKCAHLDGSFAYGEEMCFEKVHQLCKEKRYDEIFKERQLFWELFCHAICSKDNESSIPKVLFIGRKSSFKQAKRAVEAIRLCFFLNDKKSPLIILNVTIQELVLFKRPWQPCLLFSKDDFKREGINYQLYTEIIAPAFIALCSKMDRQCSYINYSQRFIIDKPPSFELNSKAWQVTQYNLREKENKGVDKLQWQNSLRYFLPKERRFKIFLDIDSVLAWWSTTPLLKGTHLKRYQIASFFHQHGLIVKVPFTNYVFPGVKELVALLLDTVDVDVCIFSKGTKFRNENLTLRIFLAASNLRKTNQDKSIEVFSIQDCFNEKKELTRLLTAADAIEDALLVDDTFTNSCPKEVANLLYMPETTHLSFIKQEFKQGFNAASGYCYVSCFFYQGIEAKYLVPQVKAKSHIALTSFQENFYVVYCEERSDKCKCALVEKDSKLCSLLKKYALDEPNYQGKKDSAEMQREAYAYVQKLGGKIYKIYRKANRLCLLTECLFGAIEKARSQNLPLKMCIPMFFPPNIRSQENRWINDDDLYLKGLVRLRQVNPSFALIHPHNFKQAIEKPLTVEEKIYLKDAIYKEIG